MAIRAIRYNEQHCIAASPMTPTDGTTASELPQAATEPDRGTRGFWALIATQFQGAYSDNILRNLLLSMIVGMGLAQSTRESLISIVTLMFSVPFLLLSMPGGWSRTVSASARSPSGRR